MTPTSNSTIGDDTSDKLDLIFGALADPTRRAILSRLSRGEATVNELAAPFDLSLPAISKHIKVLEKAGLISRKRQAQWRPCAIETSTLQEAFDWIDHYRRLWNSSLDGLDAYLRSQADESPSNAKGESS